SRVRRGRSRSLLTPDERRQRWSDLIQGEHEIDLARLNGRAWHSEEFGRGLVLGNDSAAHFLDRLYAARPVSPCTRQDDGDGPILEGWRNGMKDEIRRRSKEMNQFSSRQRQRSVGVDEKVPNRRANIDRAGAKLIAFLRPLERQAALAAQQL